jgi:lysophospholipase-2
MASSNPHIVPPTAPHTHTLIFLHGRGSDARTFQSELLESQDSSSKFFTQIFPSLKWVFPCAPKSYSLSDQEEMHQWFDMSSVQRPQENPGIQKEGLWDSVTQILRIVKEEGDIIGLENVIVAGTSQGCATAIYTLLASGLRVGGFFGLCGWLPLSDEILKLMNVPGRVKDVLDTPVLLQHSSDDEVVPVQNGEGLATYLRKSGMSVRWKRFSNGGHWLNEPKGMDGVVSFISEIMKATCAS